MKCLFLLLALLPLLALACDIKATLKFSQKLKSGFARFKFHNETYGPVYEYREGKENKPQKFQITGTLCNLKPTILETFDRDPYSGKDIKPIRSTQAFIEGMGTADYQISDYHTPYLAAKIGIFCGFGDCGNAHG